MSCQNGYIANAKCAAQNGVSRIASMSAPVVKGAVQRATSGPRAVLSYRKTCIQAQGRVAKAVGGFVGEVVKAEKAYGSGRRENMRAYNEAKGQTKVGVTSRQLLHGAGGYVAGAVISGGNPAVATLAGMAMAGRADRQKLQEQEEFSSKNFKVGLTKRQLLYGAAGFTAATAFSGGNTVLGVVAGISAARGAKAIDRDEGRRAQTPEGKAAAERFTQAQQANITTYKTSVKGAAKKLFNEVKGARSDLQAGQKAAWRTALGGQ